MTRLKWLKKVDKNKGGVNSPFFYIYSQSNKSNENNNNRTTIR